jgi:molybdate transport system permease protein
VLSEAEREMVLLSLRVAAWLWRSACARHLLGWLLARWCSPRAPVQGVLMLPLVLPPVDRLPAALAARAQPPGRAWHRSRADRSPPPPVIAAGVVGFRLVEAIRLACWVDRRLSFCRAASAAGASTFCASPSRCCRASGGLRAGARALGEPGATIVLAGNVEGETRDPCRRLHALNARGEPAALRLAG